MTQLNVSELSIYPVKSAKGLSLQSMHLNRQGPECDRRWMVIDKNQVFVTQRKFPKMCLISTELVNGELFISADDSSRCKVPAGGSKLTSSSVWGTVVSGEDCGDEAAQWVSEFLDKQCRVIYMDDDYARLVDPNFARQNQTVAFADGFPLLVTTQASLDDFNAKLLTQESQLEIGMERFRPNIVISGNDAWAEDHWQRIAIGDIELSLVKPCSRCIMPSVNPMTSEKQMEVNHALLKYRRRDKKTYFGQNALYETLGTIRVGDAVRVLD